MRAGPLGRTPLADAGFSKLTDFDSIERSAAISRDGKFAAFLSDRAGTLDAWVTQIGTGEFHNLTHGEAREFLNDEIRSIRFFPDGSLVTLWSRTHGHTPDAESIDIWRIRPDGTDAERLTFHESRVSHLAFLDRQTVRYLATIADGSGPWFHVLDVRRRESRRLVIGAERYASLAAFRAGIPAVRVLETRAGRSLEAGRRDGDRAMEHAAGAYRRRPRDIARRAAGRVHGGV